MVTNNESYLSMVKNALVSSVVYTLSPASYVATLATAIPWFLLCSMASTIALSFLAAHCLKDQNIIVFQFIYWCISWAWLGWKISPCACFHGIVMIDWLTLFCSPSCFPRQLHHVHGHHLDSRHRLRRYTLLYHYQQHWRHIRKIQDNSCEILGANGTLVGLFTVDKGCSNDGPWAKEEGCCTYPNRTWRGAESSRSCSQSSGDSK